MKKSILYAAAASAVCATLVGVPMMVSAQNAQPAAGANAAAKQVARKKVFQVHVILDQTLSVQGGKGSATMILFHGDLDTTFFKGEIQPGGVDTQRSGAISARYIIQGEDAEGTPTKIFIDNTQVNGVLKPYVLTDNPKPPKPPMAILASQSVFSSQRSFGLSVRIYGFRTPLTWVLSMKILVGVPSASVPWMM